MKLPGRCLVGVLVAITAGAAQASDGRIEINQACAVQTGCLSGDSPGFPVSLSSEKSYVLTSSLTVAADGVSAITVTGSDVSIDLNGFAIEGPYTCNIFPPNCVSNTPAAGISAPGAIRVFVRNGNVKRFSGAAVSIGFYGRVEGLRLEVGGGDGILAKAGSLVLDNQIANLAGDAIRIYFNDALLGDGRVDGNVIRSVRGDGIEMGTGVVLRNSIENIFGDDGKFGAGTGFGQNRFSTTPVGGRSMGGNVCNTSAC